MQLVCAGTKTRLIKHRGRQFTHYQDADDLKAEFIHQIFVKYIDDEEKASATCLFLHAVFLRLKRQ